MAKKRFNQENFGERMLAFRRKQGMTQQEFADQLNTSQSNIALLENGQRGPGAELLTNLFAKYRSYYSYLLTGSHTTGLENTITQEENENRSSIELQEENTRLIQQIQELTNTMAEIHSELENSADSMQSKIENILRDAVEEFVG